MDPEALNHVDWRNTSHILRYLWFIVIFAFGLATHLVLAHAIIPSLINSGHLPPGIANKARKLRIHLYLSSILILGAICFWFAMAADKAHEIRNFWHRDWI